MTKGSGSELGTWPNRRPLVRLGVSFACGLLSIVLSACGGSTKGADGGPPAGNAAVKVRRVVRQDMPLIVEVPATIEGAEMTDMVSRISGYVSRVAVDIGSEVKKDQVLIELDVPELAAELARRRQMLAETTSYAETKQFVAAKAAAELAEQQAVVQWRRKELARVTALVKSGALKADRQDESEFAVMAAEAGIKRVDADIAMIKKMIATAALKVNVARANLVRAEVGSKYQIIRAPYDGLITMREVDSGALVRPADSGGKPLLSIELVDQVRLVMFLPMTDAAQIDLGDTVKMQGFRASQSETGQYPIARYAKALHRGSRMMRAEVDLPNKKPANGKRPYVPGDYGTVLLTMHVFKGIVAIPESAIAQDSSGSDYIMVIDSGNICRKTLVSIEVRHNNLVGVSGTSPKKIEEIGNKIITADVKRFRDEESVNSADMQTDAGGNALY